MESIIKLTDCFIRKNNSFTDTNGNSQAVFNYYYKNDSGFMIIFINTYIPANAVQTIPFCVPFSAVPLCIIQPSFSTEDARVFCGASPTTTEFTVVARDTGYCSDNTSVSIELIAIGRWENAE